MRWNEGNFICRDYRDPYPSFLVKLHTVILIPLDIVILTDLLIYHGNSNLLIFVHSVRFAFNKHGRFNPFQIDYIFN